MSEHIIVLQFLFHHVLTFAWFRMPRFSGITKVPTIFLSPVLYPSLSGKLPGSLQEMLSYISYLPLCGDGGSRGDGIIPLDVATLEGSMVVELPTSKHSG